MSTFATPPTRLTLAPIALGLADLPALGEVKCTANSFLYPPTLGELRRAVSSFLHLPLAGRSIRRSAAKPERVGGGKTAELLCRRSTHDPLSTTGEAP
jgi:hypothetical protein